MGNSEIRHPCEHLRSLRADLESSHARVLLIAGWELSPVTVLRAAAQTRYSRRFRSAYGSDRSRADLPHRTSTTKSSAPPTHRRRDVELPITVASAAATVSAEIPNAGANTIPITNKGPILSRFCTAIRSASLPIQTTAISAITQSQQEQTEK